MTRDSTLSGSTAVLVAVDGSPASLAAVGVAAGVAARGAAPLDVVHVVEPPLLPHQHGPDPLPAALAAAAAAAPDLTVRALARTGAVTAVLAELARDYTLVVVGSRGHGALTDAAIGSHAIALAGSLPCPLLVVRPGAERRRRGGPVVVALAGDGADGPVLDLAFAEAAARGVALVAVHSRAHRYLGAGRLVLAAVAPQALGASEDVVADEIGPWARRHPEVEVRLTVGHGRPEAVVLDAARGASLVVVGTRGRGARSGLLLGSVAQGVLHRAHCPVAVVPGR